MRRYEWNHLSVVWSGNQREICLQDILDYSVLCAHFTQYRLAFYLDLYSILQQKIDIKYRFFVAFCKFQATFSSIRSTTRRDVWSKPMSLLSRCLTMSCTPTSCCFLLYAVYLVWCVRQKIWQKRKKKIIPIAYYWLVSRSYCIWFCVYLFISSIFLAMILLSVWVSLGPSI